MKKLVISLLLSMLIFQHLPAFSQAKLPVKLGLKVSGNIDWMNPATKGYTSDGARMGGVIGFMGDFYFAENYAVSTGFNFQFLSGKLNYADSLRTWNPATLKSEMINGEVFRKYNFMYLEIPLMIKMKTKVFGKVSYYGQIGLGTGFRLKASVNEHFVPESGSAIDQDYEFNNGTTLIRESILFGFGCEMNIDESSRLVVGLSYSNSLNNVLTGVNYKSGLNEKSMLNYAELTVGILF